MRQAELQQYRAMLQAQMVEPPKRRLFGPRAAALVALDPAPSAILEPAVRSEPAPSGPPPARGGLLFGRRQPEPAVELEAPLILDTPVEPSPRLRLSAPAGAGHWAETPFHAEDLADPPAPSGPAPGVIAGWSAARPPSAQTRLLRRLGAVIEAERHGLGARLMAAGIETG